MQQIVDGVVYEAVPGGECAQCPGDENEALCLKLNRRCVQDNLAWRRKIDHGETETRRGRT